MTVDGGSNWKVVRAGINDGGYPVGSVHKETGESLNSKPLVSVHCGGASAETVCLAPLQVGLLMKEITRI
jgi:hypothetical protein